MADGGERQLHVDRDRLRLLPKPGDARIGDRVACLPADPTLDDAARRVEHCRRPPGHTRGAVRLLGGPDRGEQRLLAPGPRDVAVPRLVVEPVVLDDEDRDRLRDCMRRAGIETGLHYPVPLHAQPALARFVADAHSFPVANRYARECLSLPLFVGMTEVQVDRVCETIRRFYR